MRRPRRVRHAQPDERVLSLTEWLATLHRPPRVRPALVDERTSRTVHAFGAGVVFEERLAGRLRSGAAAAAPHVGGALIEQTPPDAACPRGVTDRRKGDNPA